jgi:serine/threonine protein kinase
VQEKGFDVLKWESTVLKTLSDHSNNVPKYYANDAVNGQDYLVMELLTGEDMATLRNRLRVKNPSGLIPLPIASYLARQMLNCLHQMHKNGYIHRDVKPSNFVRKSKTSSEFLTIDFGLAKQVSD